MFITWTKLVRPQNKQDMIMITVLDKVEKYGKVLVEILKGFLFYTT